MRLNIVALQDQMDAVRYCTQWLLNHLDKMDAYSPVQLASATTKHRVIEFIRQQKQQAAERFAAPMVNMSPTPDLRTSHELTNKV